MKSFWFGSNFSNIQRVKKSRTLKDDNVTLEKAWFDSTYRQDRT